MKLSSAVLWICLLSILTSLPLPLLALIGLEYSPREQDIVFLHDMLPRFNVILPCVYQ